MSFSLARRRALVTGGTEGLGRAIAETFLEAGASVVVTGRSPDKGRALCEEHLGEPLWFVQEDGTQRSSVDEAVDRAAGHLGGLDILINNVGGSAGFAPLHEMSDDAWDHAWRLNVSSTFWATRRSLPHLLTAGSGRIINMSSVEGKQATFPCVAHYVTTKHALAGFTKAVALEYGPQGITCNAICPGKVMTESVPTTQAAASAAGMSYEQFIGRFVDDTKTKRLNTAAEVASVALLLASEHGAGITGTCLSVDGGTASW